MAKRKNLLEKVEAQFVKEGNRQCQIFLSAAALALYRNWGWKKDRITRTLQVAEDAWVECSQDMGLSMIAMCEKETGIEVQCGDGKSWRELDYLNGHWPEQMNDAKWIYMRQRQRRWIAPQITASILIALHRREGFGFDRCARVYQQIDDIRTEYGLDPKKIREACLKETLVNVHDMINKKPEGVNT